MLISCCWELINIVMVMDVIFLEFGIRLLLLLLLLLLLSGGYYFESWSMEKIASEFVSYSPF